MKTTTQDRYEMLLDCKCGKSITSKNGIKIIEDLEELLDHYQEMKEGLAKLENILKGNKGVSYE